MRKEELRNLERIKVTPLMVKLAKENKLKTPITYNTEWGEVQKETKYDMFLRCQTRGEILMVALFFPDDLGAGFKEPAYEIYINPEGNEFITRILHMGNEKWSTAKMENLEKVHYKTDISCYWPMRREEVDSRIWQYQGEKNTIKSFLRTSKGGWQGIKEWQDKARGEKIKQQEERQQKPWDEDMTLVPSILPGFKRWTEHDATNEHFIFYDYGAKTGYCSYCEKQVPVSKPLHNKKAVCQCCRKKVTLKASGKIKTLKRKAYYTECIQKIKGGFVIRRFRTYMWWRDRRPDNPHISMAEEDRALVFDNGVCRNYVWGMYKNKKMRWLPIGGDYITYGTAKLYTKNLNSLKKGVLKESAIDVWPQLPCRATRYLYAERKNPVIEKLARVKLFRLAEEILADVRDARDVLNDEETELAKMLKIDKARLKRLKAMDANMYSLRWMQYEKLVNTIWPDEMIKDFGEAEFHTAAFGFLPVPISFVKIHNYLKKQAALAGESLAQTKRTWEDYINMAEKAKWNTASEQLLYPKNLKEAHGKVVLYLQGDSMKKQAKALEKKWPKVNGILPALKKFEYTSGKYQIAVPNDILDIVKEGTALRHCVHTCDFYFDRIQKNETYLFFLRKSDAPDTPWYTLEVEPSGNIRQKRTTGDNQNQDFKEAVAFLKEWQRVFQGRLTKEERELGILADQARIEEYKKLRKDGNKVWHGRLAGKLLADVLEADFMSAT